MKMWYKNDGSDKDVVVSTRIRLARNAEKIAFPPEYTKQQAEEISNAVREALDGSGFEFLNLDNAPELNCRALVEKHIISPQMLKGKNKSVFLSKDGDVSIMLGEEDHIRLQVIGAGLELREAYKRANEIDDMIGKKVLYAYNGKYGFLTKCPTNAGTGLRASVMLYLPALSMAGRMNMLIGEIGKMGLTMRGIYGEGSESKGNMYQLSNQITLGVSENDIINKLENIAKQIIQTERELRDKLYKRSKEEMEDKVYRAYGILKYAKKLTSSECGELLSALKLGVCLNIFNLTDLDTINELIVLTEPAHICLENGGELSAEQRDKFRAQLVNERI